MSFFNNLATFVVISTDLWVLGQYIYIYMSVFFLGESRPPERHGLFCVMLDLAGSCGPAIRC